MRLFFYAVILLCCPFFLFSQIAPELPRYDRLKVHLVDRSIQELALLGVEVDHGEYRPGRYLVNDFSEYEVAQIMAAGFEVEVLIRDVSEFYVAHRHDPAPETNQRGPGDCEDEAPVMDMSDIVDPSYFRLGDMAGFYRYQEMIDILDSMRLLFPNLITSRRTIDNAATHQGRPIYWLRISDNPDTDETTEEEVLYTALHHAREPNSLTQMIYYMWYLLENYGTDPEVTYLIDHTELYFIPCINPDGYLFNEATNPDGGGMWRKNLRNNEDGSTGVDLNRNYGYEWGYDDEGSSPIGSSLVYRGTSPFSEPETQAVRDFCNQHEFRATLNYHSYGNLLIYPWGYSDTATDNAETFNTLASVMTLQNDYLAGTGSETVGYTVNGNSDDWMYGETGTKPAIFSMTPEVGVGSGGFWPPISSIVPNCRASLWMNLVTANVPHAAGVLLPDPAQLELSVVGPSVRYSLQRFGLSAGALTVSLTSLDPAISIPANSQTYELAANEIVVDSFQLIVDPSLTPGTEVLFLLTLDNGHYVREDTIRRVYSNLLATAAYTESFEEIDDWEMGEQGWGVTEEDFVSAPSSLTDSPYEPYPNNSYSTITLDNPVVVAAAEAYHLRFWARWDIEAFYDYAQLQVQVNEGAWIPVCGLYTINGSELQDFDQPVYEGQQDDWVKEEIDLTPLLSAGDQLRLRWLLDADAFINPDGYYVDDIQLEELNAGDPTRTRWLTKEEFSLSIMPNPSRGPTQMRFRLTEDESHKMGQWQLIDAKGQLIRSGDLSFTNGVGEVLLQEPLSTGLYWVRAQVGTAQLPAQKLIIIR